MTLRKLLVGFNLSLLLTLFLSAALPFMLLDRSVSVYFSNNTASIGIMLLSFIAINMYFACNWTLFCSLEKGDWYTVLYLLRTKICEKKQYKKKYIFYFIEVAIQLNDLELLRELFEELQAQANILNKRPSTQKCKGCPIGELMARRWSWENHKNYRLALYARKRLCEYAIEFGLPYLMNDPGYGSEVYFGGLREFQAFQQQRYIHKYKWAELFYAISLLVQGKLKFAAERLEQLLLPQSMGDTVPNTLLRQWKIHWRLREDALPQLVSIQLLEDLQENFKQQGEPFIVDQQLIDLCRGKIQKIYDSPKHWLSYLLKEQNQNIAITMIHQLIDAAYEQQLRPAHEEYLIGLKTRGKTARPVEQIRN